MKYLFTSDLHLFHPNIIRYCGRPFPDVQKMKDTIIRNWNTHVKDEDTVFHVGDFFLAKSSEAPDSVRHFQDVRKLLKGNIIFIQGNHDHNIKNQAIIRNCTIRYGGISLFLVHNPEYANQNVAVNLVGHVHEKWTVKILNEHSIAINVGVDVWDFKPVVIDSITNLYNSFRNGNLKVGKFHHPHLTGKVGLCVGYNKDEIC